MTDGNTYVIDNSVSFSNETVGGSGITIADNATVVVLVPADVALTAIGANGSGRAGGGAGIRVPETSTIVITGEGTVNANGGNAGNGENGKNGGHGSASSSGKKSDGRDGNGGSGGGGAGAGIGGSGGSGGSSGGYNGSDGENCGVVYILGSVEVLTCSGLAGRAGVNGEMGSTATAKVPDPTETSGYHLVYGYGGVGGRGGGAGSSPIYSIGGGGSGGGGGGMGIQRSGIAGDEGALGVLYISPASKVDLSREMRLTNTCEAAQRLITFNANGGQLAPETESLTATIGCELPNCIVSPTRTGYLFCGWEDDEGIEYYGKDGEKSLSAYSVAEDVALYARWVEDPQALIISPNSGTVFNDTLSILMSSSISGATIYYTMDGSEPTPSATVYNRRFRIDGKTTIKAIAVCGEWISSEVAVAHYALGQCPDPVIVSAGGGTFSHGSVQVSVGWEGADGVLRYTTDGSDVTETSPEYAGAFAIDDTTTIKAKAFGETYFDSKQVELTVTHEWEPVATPVIAATESFSGRKTMVSISCATEGATIRYTVDGSEPNSHSMRYSGAFEVRESTVVKAFAMLADYANSEVATKTITKVWGIGDSVGLPDHAFTTDGDAEWVNDGDAAMRSGKITHKQTSVLRSTFVGKGRLTFELKTSCEEDLPQYMEYDRAEVWMNGALKMKQDGVHDWMPFEFDLDGASTTVEWRYVKDALDDAKYPGEDCIWVRNIVWLPELTCTTEAPVELSWIREKFGDLGNYYYDYEEKAKETAANGHEVWECYVAGEDPTDNTSRFTATIKIGVGGKPIVSWKPSLNGEDADGAGIREGVRSYSVYGREALVNAAEEWKLVTEGEEENYRFFKVKVGMPEQK